MRNTVEQTGKQVHTMLQLPLEIAKELYNELYVEREHSDMQKYKLEELIEVLEDAEDGQASIKYVR
jgi:transcriptional regulator with GAF, ATPase, and Fis domain